MSTFQVAASVTVVEEAPVGDTSEDTQPLPEAEVPPQEDDKYRRPLQLYRHWVR